MLYLLQITLTESLQPQKVDLMCDICIITIDSVYTYVEDLDNERAVEAFLTGVCQYVPHDIFGWCEELIKVYYQQLIESILDGFPPYEVCESVKLC
ncbi:Saposin-like_type B domin-containing protein [Hexamita inflata]|uniref:Saposin-like type B domin-containing protein n=1 Tax=Hexamita inflata TaxID=28002 RepID=A0AA86UVG9_9EUKA|nr:Saposin-like type B domin-containing protein [Hexamita inflata]